MKGRDKLFYLFLATICSASIGLIFKYTEGSNTNRLVITSSNYLMALSISLFLFIIGDNLQNIEKTESFFSEFSYLLSQDSYILSSYSSIIWGMIVGSIAGIFFFASFIFYQKSVRENGAGLSGAFGKIGILIPMTLSIILWREFPTTIQWVGIFLAIISIIIVNISKEDKKKLDLKYLLILLFIFGGLAEFSNKIYQQYALNEYRNVFLFFVFFVAFIISSVYTLRSKSKIKLRDILIGFSVGIPNLFSSYFLILALDSLKTSVVFPVYSAGSIVLINIGSFFLFKEHINKKNRIAIILTVIALIMINI